MYVSEVDFGLECESFLVWGKDVVFAWWTVFVCGYWGFCLCEWVGFNLHC